MNYNIMEDVEKITGVSEKYLLKMVLAELYSINSAVSESVVNKETYTDIDIGIGTLVVKVEENDIQYKFIPSKKLESTIRDTVINEQNLLERKLEQSLSDKLAKVYKDLL